MACPDRRAEAAADGVHELPHAAADRPVDIQCRTVRPVLERMAGYANNTIQARVQMRVAPVKIKAPLSPSSPPIWRR